MTAFRFLPLSMAIGLALSAPAQAQNLIDLYESARAFDASYQSAKSQFDATMAKAEQARAALLPTVGLSAGLTLGVVDNSLPTAPKQGGYNSQSATLSASHPLYRPANQATYAQGQKQKDLAQWQLAAADQDLIVRVSQAYFEVLAAQDNLGFVMAQKAAVTEQLAAAKRNFEVGTSTITDSREAQARFDLVTAQEIAARNDEQVKKLALDQLVGKTVTQPKGVALPLALASPEPADVGNWVQLSADNHPGVKQGQIALEVAQLETRKAESASGPTLDATAGLNVTQNNESPSSPATFRTTTGTVGLSFNLPLFSGYAIENRLKETLALEDKARNDLEAAKRAVAQSTRSAYFGVLSGQGQVKALEAAEASSQSALDANKLGYQVGVRINIDVLNAQSQLFDTKAKLAKARYDVLLGGLRLRQASGVLKVEDLKAVNALLAP